MGKEGLMITLEIPIGQPFIKWHSKPGEITKIYVRTGKVAHPDIHWGNEMIPGINGYEICREIHTGTEKLILSEGWVELVDHKCLFCSWIQNT